MGQHAVGLPGVSRGPADDINSALEQPLGGWGVPVISGRLADKAHEVPIDCSAEPVPQAAPNTDDSDVQRVNWAWHY